MKLAIVSLEDEKEVRDAILRDLEPFGDVVRIEPAEDVEDAWDLIAELDQEGDLLALVLADHRLPGTTGVQFLISMQQDERTALASKVLLTGQADHSDTIRAINEAGLDHYLSKPWQPDELRKIVRRELSAFVMRVGIDPTPHLAALDTEIVLDSLRDLSE